MSLKALLQSEIKRRGYLSIQELEDFARRENKKLSNAERRLRPSESPMIEKVMDERNHHIIGYRYKQSKVLQEVREILKKHREENPLSRQIKLI